MLVLIPRESNGHKIRTESYVVILSTYCQDQDQQQYFKTFCCLYLTPILLLPSSGYKKFLDPKELLL